MSIPCRSDSRSLQNPLFLTKKWLSGTGFSQPLPSLLQDDWELQDIPKEILAVRTNQQGIKEALVQ